MWRDRQPGIQHQEDWALTPFVPLTGCETFESPFPGLVLHHLLNGSGNIPHRVQSGAHVQ